MSLLDAAMIRRDVTTDTISPLSVNSSSADIASKKLTKFFSKSTETASASAKKSEINVGAAFLDLDFLNKVRESFDLAGLKIIAKKHGLDINKPADLKKAREIQEKEHRTFMTNYNSKKAYVDNKKINGLSYNEAQKANKQLIQKFRGFIGAYTWSDAWHGPVLDNDRMTGVIAQFGTSEEHNLWLRSLSAIKQFESDADFMKKYDAVYTISHIHENYEG